MTPYDDKFVEYCKSDAYNTLYLFRRIQKYKSKHKWFIWLYFKFIKLKFFRKFFKKDKRSFTGFELLGGDFDGDPIIGLDLTLGNDFAGGTKNEHSV